MINWKKVRKWTGRILLAVFTVGLTVIGIWGIKVRNDEPKAIEEKSISEGYRDINPT